MMPARAILADDHQLLLDALEKLLAPDIDVVAKVTDGRALLAAADRVHSDVVVLDMLMPGLNGLDAAKQLRARHPHIGLVVVTMLDAPAVAAEAVRLGACGYVLKSSAASELLTAIGEVLHRRCYITPLIAGRVIEALSHRHAPALHHELTGRQREVLQLIAEGRSMKEAAAILNITARTVAFHKYRLMEQLHLRTTAELIQFAIHEHLIVDRVSGH